MLQDGPIDVSGAIDARVLEAGEMLDALRDLPVGAHTLAFTGLVVGLVLWSFGRRFVRPGFALVGMVIGAVLGFFTTASIPMIDPFPIPAPYVGLGGGALGGVILAVLLFRVAMAASTALVMALMGVLVACTYLDLKLEPADGATTHAVNEFQLDAPEDTSSFELPPFLSPVSNEAPTDAERAARGATVKTRRFVRALGAELTSLWDRLPEQSQIVLGLSAALGGAIGALSGIGAPRRTAGAVTAMLGAGMFLPCLVWIAHVKDLPGRDLLHRRPLEWIMIWLGVSAVGIVIQWTALRPPKKPAPAPPKKEE
jgi:hypothetical protein